ncbi:MAG TPA: HPF/RaiA family ribosome-associated protein [Parafilimonas sp.]|nr:HPF/RaiA family ribosome-associated protein [Parafilimonas sp.]
MTIEFHAPYHKIKEQVIEHVKKKLLELHHCNKQIVRAEVYFKENAEAKDGAKICEIELTVYGDSLFVRRHANNFKQAAKEAIEALRTEVNKQIKQQTQPPDTVTSTVRV